MKNTPFLSRFLLSVALSLVTSFTFANVILFQSSFENEVTTEWSSTYKEGLTFFDRDVAAKYTGSYGFRMLFSGSTQKGNLTTPKNIKWETGATYLISFWYKSVNPSDNGLSNLKLFKNDGTKIGQLNLSSWTSTSWTKISLTFQCSTNDIDGYALFNFMPNNIGNSEYFFDDFVIEKVVDNTAYFNNLQKNAVASTGTVSWKQIGPGMAGYCEEFWCHPTDEKTMFMSPDMYNSYGTWDGGKTWQTIKDCDGTGIYMRRVQAITFSKQNPDFGLAIDVRGYLFSTNDRGHNWTKEAFTGSGRYSELAVDPTNDQVWYLGAGDFWNVKSNHRSKANLTDPSTGYFYAYAAYGHIYKSTDGGKNWVKKTSGLPAKADIGKIIVDPTNPLIIIAATNYGLYRSTDAGENWTKGGSGLPNNMPRDMDYYYDAITGEFILYVVDQTSFELSGSIVSSKGGVYKSLDHGITWTAINGNLAINLQSITSSAARSEYYESLAFWLGTTTDLAKTNYPTLPTSVFSVFNRIRINPNNKNEIYLTHNVKHDYAFGPGDVWKTEDGGNTWKVVTRTGTYWKTNSDAAYWASRNNPTTPNTNFGHIQSEMDRSEEWSGNRFMEINKIGEVFICIDQQTFKSTDGNTWNQIDDVETSAGSKHWVGSGDSNLPGRFILLETGVRNRYLFCSGEHGLWQTASLDNYPDSMAVALEQIEGQVNENGATSIATVAVHPNDPNTIYILMFRQNHRGYFRKSTDGGKTWTNISKPVNWDLNISSDMMFQYSLVIDPNYPDNIYFCMPENAPTDVSSSSVPSAFKDFGVYKSTNGGVNWTLANNGFPTNSSVHRIIIDPKQSSTLYAALNISKTSVSGGLYKSIDNGTNWVKMSIPSTIKSVNNVFIDRNTNYIFISCGTETGTFDEGGVWRSKDNGENWEKIFFMPYIMQTETSPVNPNIITVNAMGPKESSPATYLNPGAYLSKDGGESWEKINTNLGQANVITDLKPDPYTEGIYWCAQFGSGWAIGYDKDHKNAWWPNSISATSTDSIKTQSRTKVYPNPVKDILNIGDIQTNNAVQIFNLKGELVLQNQNSNLINVSKLQTGLFIIYIQNDLENFITKFIKE